MKSLLEALLGRAELVGLEVEVSEADHGPQVLRLDPARLVELLRSLAQVAIVDVDLSEPQIAVYVVREGLEDPEIELRRLLVPFRVLPASFRVKGRAGWGLAGRTSKTLATLYVMVMCRAS